MTTIEAEDRVAIFLGLLGEESAAALLDQLDSTRFEDVRQRLSELSEDPPDDAEVDGIIDEFERFFRFAVGSEDDTPGDDAGDNPAAEAGGTPQAVEPFQMSDDPLDDLNKLRPFQIAAALEVEQPRTIAIVFEHLESELAAKVMQRLPAELRGEVFLLLDSQSQLPHALQLRMVRTVVEKAAKVLEDAEAAKAGDTDQKTADILRGMGRQERNELLEKLEEANGEKAQRIKSLIYSFDDLGHLSDRHVQKVLSEIDSKALSLALNDAPTELVDGVLNNLSRRARESLTEEMSLLGDVKPEEQEEARQETINVIIRLEQLGEIAVKME